MTENELNEDGKCLLVDYADNERVIACLHGRVEDAARALSALAEKSKSGLAEKERHKATDAIRKCGSSEIARYGEALVERERLVKRLKNTAYSHMIRSGE